MERANDSNEFDIQSYERKYMVGRRRETALFRRMLEGAVPDKRIIHLYGIGGMGKSFLLDEFRRIAADSGALFLLLDSRDFLHTPQALCARALQLLQDRESFEAADLSPAEAARAINAAAAKRRVCIAFDTYEEMGALDRWIREQWIPQLHPNVLFAFAGRFPLDGAWKQSPAWRTLIAWVPLAELTYEDVETYLGLHDVRSEEWTRLIWNKTKGHPLSLSLAAYAATTYEAGPLPSLDALPLDAGDWMQEVYPELRPLVEAASVLRHFNQDLLAHLADRPVTNDEFRALTELSFVRRLERGWMLHDLVRAVVAEDLRVRTPELYEALWRRCVTYFYRRAARLAGTAPDASWEACEAFYYFGDQLIRDFFYQTASPHYWETVDESNAREAEAYLARRRAQAKEARIPYPDPETGLTKEFVITAEQSLFPIKHLHLEELRRLPGAQIRLLRRPSGEAAGLSVVIAINGRTLDFLLNRPLSSAFFRGLDPQQLQDMRAADEFDYGLFVYGIDVLDFGDWTLRADAGLFFITQMLTGGFVAGSPPPLPFFNEVHRRLGCDVAEAVHYDYDGRTPSYTYYLDTRGQRLHRYLRKMAQQLGLAELAGGEEAAPAAAALPELTEREAEIVALVGRGLTNAEVAKRLFVSEITVKKHLTAVFQKLGVKNRTELVRRTVGRS